MIDSKHMFIFVHIPKSGGQSICNALLKLHDKSFSVRAVETGDLNDFLIRAKKKGESGPDVLAHMTMSEYLEHGYICSDIYDTYYKFSIVRNPWDRLVSEYIYHKYHKKMSFKQFIIDVVDKVEFGNTDHNPDRHLELQYNFVHDKEGNCMVDYIGKFEELDEVYTTVCKSLNISKVPLNKLNSTKREHYSKYYDEDTIEIVRKKYKKDIDMWGYKYDD